MASIENIVRGVLVQAQHLLVCKNKKKDYFYLPGGHIEFGESMVEALQREWQEELGVTCEVQKFLAFFEERFTDADHFKHHEYTFLYNVSCPTILQNQTPPSAESHIEFHWLPTADLPKYILLPQNTQKYLVDFFEDNFEDKDKGINDPNRE